MIDAAILVVSGTSTPSIDVNLVDPSGMIAEIRVEGAKLGSGVSGIVVGERCLG